MRKGSKKPILIYTGALAGALTLAVGSAFAGEIGPDTAAGMQKLSGSNLTCSPGAPEYQRKTPTGPVPDGAKLQACNKCKSAVDQQKQKIEQSRNQAIQQNNAAVGAGSAGTSAIGAAATGQQKNSQGSTSGVNNVGTSAQAQRAAIARALGQDAQTCSSQIQSSCSVTLSSSDKNAAESAAQGCQQIADASNANSVEKAASGGGMGDMSQLAGALGQALGQMMQGGQGADAGATPDTSSITTPDTVAGTSITPPSSNVGGTSIAATPGSVGGVQFTKPSSANISGFTPGSSSFGPASSGAYDAAAGSGYDGIGSNGGAGAAGYTSSGSGGSAGLNSSGSSVAGLNGDAANGAGAGNAASAGPNDEINLASGGGGGAKPSFLGLKSSADEEQPGEPGVLDDLGLGSDEEGSRDLASNEEAGIAAEDSGTLFTVIHTKISEIKRRGSI